uniref:Peptidase M24 domain-containing protein n=2 Tax=Plectus sambesii TaxID=2011161 RepID=A0A914X121_9BILA
MSDREDRAGSDSESEDETLANDLVVTKYNMAADIVNAILKELIAEVKEGVEVGALCDSGDKKLAERTAKIFKKEKNVKKGSAFPTCISVNHCICHYSPLRSETAITLKNGDVVKIDLGAHIDGYIATAAHTVVVGASKDQKVTGRKADAIHAAYNAMEAAIRMLRPGQHKNMEVTDTIQRFADIYQVKPVENMLSHQIKRNKIDGEKQIIQAPGEKQRSEMEKCEFDKYEVYAIDVLMSTGDGKGRDLDTRTTVYKKSDDLVYSLKMKASRTFLSEAVNKFGSMPFTLRSWEEEKTAKLGVIECERHGLMKPYQVLYERDNEIVAQFKSTVLVMPNGLLKITGLPLDTEVYSTEHKVDDEKLSQLLASSLKPSKKKTKKATDESEKKDGAPAEKKDATPAKKDDAAAKDAKNAKSPAAAANGTDKNAKSAKPAKTKA